MPVLHQMQISGNCYKVRLAARQLGVALTLKNYGLHDGATRRPDFFPRIRMAACRCSNSRMAARFRSRMRSCGT